MKKKFYFPTVQEITDINKLVLQEIPVSKHDKFGLFKEEKVMKAIIRKAKNTKDDAYDKATTLLIELVRQHPFRAGNRRTAYAVAESFLFHNLDKAPLMDTTKRDTVLNGIRENYYTRKEIKKWLKGGKIREFKK